MRANGSIEGAAAAFTVGDGVYVMKKYDDSKVYVVGRVDGVKHCDYRYVIFSVDLSGPLFVRTVIVWDAENDCVATVPGVTFPCFVTDPNYVSWLATKTTSSGDSFISGMASRGNYYSHIVEAVAKPGLVTIANDYPPGANTDTYYYEDLGALVGKYYRSVIYALKPEPIPPIDISAKWKSYAGKLINEDLSVSDTVIGFRTYQNFEEINLYQEHPGDPERWAQCTAYLEDPFGNKMIEWSDPVPVIGGKYDSMFWTMYRYYRNAEPQFGNPPEPDYVPYMAGRKTRTKSILVTCHQFCPSKYIASWEAGDREFYVSARTDNRAGNIEDVGIIGKERNADLSDLIKSAYVLLYSQSGIPGGVYNAWENILFAR